MALYPVCDDLFNAGCRYCAALLIVESKVGVEPHATDRNATVTFLRYRGRTYGITCRHVVESLRRMNESSGGATRYVFATVVRGTFFLLDRFFFPPSDTPHARPLDVAMREIDPEYPPRIAKAAIPLDNQRIPPWEEVTHAVAVGFPEHEKTVETSRLESRIAMPCAKAIAENVSPEGDHIMLFSELVDKPAVEDFSGMSGGPAFWSTEDDYGLLGIVCEALPPDPTTSHDAESPLGAGPRICMVAERVTPDRFRRWVGGLHDGPRSG